MAVYLDTEARLTIINPIDLVNFVTEIASHPLHQLWNNDDLEAKMDKIFFKAFRQNLIVNRGAGRQVMLHIGERPPLPTGKDRLANEFRSAINRLPLLHMQGDGIRAFAGVLASALASDRDVIFVD